MVAGKLFAVPPLVQNRGRVRFESVVRISSASVPLGGPAEHNSKLAIDSLAHVRNFPHEVLLFPHLEARTLVSAISWQSLITEY